MRTIDASQLSSSQKVLCHSMTLVAEIWNSHVMSLIYANANPLQPGSSLPSKIQSIAINEHMVHPKKRNQFPKIIMIFGNCVTYFG